MLVEPSTAGLASNTPLLCRDREDPGMSMAMWAAPRMGTGPELIGDPAGSPVPPPTRDPDEERLS